MLNTVQSLAMTEDTMAESQEIEAEAPPEAIFMAPSVWRPEVLAGRSYTHESDLPKVLAEDMKTECVLGVDEAGRGPVLGTADVSASESTQS